MTADAARMKGRPTPRKVRLGERAAKTVRRWNREKFAEIRAAVSAANHRERGRLLAMIR